MTIFSLGTWKELNVKLESQPFELKCLVGVPLFSSTFGHFAWVSNFRFCKWPFFPLELGRISS